MAFTFDDAGRVLATRLGATVLAASTYDAAGELATVTYSNGSALSEVGKDSAGRVTALTWKTSDNREVASAVTRTRAGTVTDETLAGVDARPNAPNYLYDSVGRLTEVWVTGHHYTYDFTSAAPAGCPTGTQANAGLNTNRVRLLDQTASGTAETGYCYDAADRILATAGAAAVTSISYDSHGNTTGYIAGSATTTLGWDGADRNIAARTTGADPAEVAYARDATDRLIRRDATAGDTTATVLYAYTGGGDSADVAFGGDLRLATRSIYTPFGEPLTTTGTVDPDAVPDNQPGQMDHGWLGQLQRPYEHAGALALVQMGARLYSPLLGRFLSVDPVEGGSANDYDYTNADPTNTTDLDGQAPWIPIIIGCIKWRNKVGRIAWRVAKWGYRKIIRPSVIWTGNTLKSGARELFGLQSRLLGRHKKGVLIEIVSFDLDGHGEDPLKLEEMSLDWPSAPGAVCLGSAAEGLLYINT